MSKSSNRPKEQCKTSPEVDIGGNNPPEIPIDSMDFSFEFRPVERIARRKSKAETTEKESSQETIPNIAYAYRDCMASFSSLMCYLLEYMHQVGSNSAKSIHTNYAQIYRVFINMIFDAKRNRKKTDIEVSLHFFSKINPAHFEIVIPLVDEDNLRSILQYRDAAVAAPKILSETMIQQIVNTWETLLGSLIETRIDSKILKENAKIQVSLSEIDACADIAEIRKLFIGKILREFLGQNIDEQIAKLNTDYRIDFSSSFGRAHLADLKETIAQRHVFVHCNSIATPEYCERIRKLKKNALIPGDPLILSPQDLYHAWDVFFAAGLVVVHMFQVNHARQLKSQKMEDNAFAALVTESHTALEQNRNEAACIMLQYANKLSIRAEWPRLAIKINLALAYKRMGNIQKCNQVLSECDWNVCDDQFKAAVAALRGDNKEALKLICKLCRKDESFVKSAHAWVVFEEVRREKAFEEEMQKLLSKKGKQMVQVPAPAVHFSKETDEKAMLKKLYDVALAFRQKDSACPTMPKSNSNPTSPSIGNPSTMKP